MKILIVKMSSMGDIIHTLPAVTDLHCQRPDVTIDWVVEQGFASIPKHHRGVNQVIPIALRRWRKNWLSNENRAEIKNFYRQLRAQQYDLIIDAQGLLKSAIVSRLARGPIAGYHYQSAREPIASLLYQHRFKIDKAQHAIQRSRELFAKACNYTLPTSAANFNLQAKTGAANNDYIVCIPGTTWATKHWPEQHWQSLINKLSTNNFKVKLSWGTSAEYELAKRLQQNLANVEILPFLPIAEMLTVLANARGVIGVDTGFVHMTEALNKPMVSLYGATDPDRTGSLNQKQLALSAKFPCAPCLQRQCNYKGQTELFPACMAMLKPEYVYQQFMLTLKK
ncbi:MAG: lipopolysaccharide heptosyltransferase I [Gammaproteobacteria bacterium]|nr:lipopolysaccharide heptosyltransferase I [Gammaproteobacteria bacterium]